MAGSLLWLAAPRHETHEEVVTTGDHDRAITVERLIGASLRQIGREPRVVWHFGVTRFRVELGENPPGDLARRFVGRPKSATRIEGKWRLEEAKDQLVLYDLVGEDFKMSSEVILPILPAGLLRANLGEQQYSVNEFDIAGQWESVGDGPQISWSLTFEPLITRGSPFVVECNKGPLPKEITSKLLAQPAEVSRIEGEWKFDRFAKRLELRKVTAGTHRQHTARADSRRG